MLDIKQIITQINVKRCIMTSAVSENIYISTRGNLTWGPGSIHCYNYVILYLCIYMRDAYFETDLGLIPICALVFL